MEAPYKRRFTYQNGNSSKFWEVEVQGFFVTTRWGRIGTNGQSMQDVFSTTDGALAAAQKKCTEKIRKGYTEEKLQPVVVVKAKRAKRTTPKEQTTAPKPTRPKVTKPKPAQPVLEKPKRKVKI